jgi:mannose-6-phosphate isomerase-like protein (cupin superfamily)
MLGRILRRLTLRSGGREKRPIYFANSSLISKFPHDRTKHRSTGTIRDQGWLDHPEHSRPDDAPVQKQSLAEARVPSGSATQRHYHKLAEEFYFIQEGTGTIEIDGATSEVAPGDAILIPAGAWHTITAHQELRFLCCCAPPYSHEDTYFD